MTSFSDVYLTSLSETVMINLYNFLVGSSIAIEIQQLLCSILENGTTLFGTFDICSKNDQGVSILGGN
jgi:hypothetical protein